MAHQVQTSNNQVAPGSSVPVILTHLSKMEFHIILCLALASLQSVTDGQMYEGGLTAAAPTRSYILAHRNRREVSLV